MTLVVKKDGFKEPFSEAKVRKGLERASLEAGLSQERATEVVGVVASALLTQLTLKEEVQSSEIRDAVLAELDRIAPEVSAHWRRYNQTVKKNA